jgi:hypothetical protein
MSSGVSGGGGVRSNGKITRSVSTTIILLEAKLWKEGREAINGNQLRSNGNQWQSNAIDGDHLKRVYAINCNQS